MNILVADPEPAIRRHICDFIEKMGHRAEAATTGDEVVQHLATHEYCLLLLDADLRQGSGDPLDSWVTDRYPNTPVVIMSSAPSVRAVISAMRRGVFDYIIKPYEILELASIVPRAISWWTDRSRDRKNDTASSTTPERPIAAVD